MLTVLQFRIYRCYGRGRYAYQIISLLYADVAWAPQGGTWDREASYFVRALCDHFGGKAQHSQEMATDTNESQHDGRAEAANRQEILPPKIPVEDEWALKCITVHGMQSLMEALDDDASSFVTVKEVNEFIRRKPNGWRCASGASAALCC